MRLACDSVRRARPLLGTIVEIAVGGTARPDMNAAVDAAFGSVAEVHRLMSFHEPTSDVSRLNREAGGRAIAVHRWTYTVLEAALDLHRRSARLFDIAVAPTMQELGLLPPSAHDSRLGPVTGAGSGAIELLSGCQVRVHDPGTRVDLGGIAKGFAVDRAVDTLRAHGMPSGLVNAGGDLAAFGPEPPLVTIRDPRDPLRAMCCLELKDGALASSGGRFDPFARSGAASLAIIDPRTRRPVQAIAGAAVRASSCMVADALTKVVVIASESAIRLLGHYGASALVVPSAGDVRVTSDWPRAVPLAA